MYVLPTADVTPVLLIVNVVLPLPVDAAEIEIAFPPTGATDVSTRLALSKTAAA